MRLTKAESRVLRLLVSHSDEGRRFVIAGTRETSRRVLEALSRKGLLLYQEVERFEPDAPRYWTIPTAKGLEEVRKVGS